MYEEKTKLSGFQLTEYKKEAFPEDQHNEIATTPVLHSIDRILRKTPSQALR
jgi:hypothetical protein